MMTRLGLLAALVGLSGLLAGCGAEDTDDGGASSTPDGGATGGAGAGGGASASGGSFPGTAEELMAAWVEAECAARERCCASIEQPTDYDECVAERRGWNASGVGQRVADGVIEVDMATADECLDGLSRMGCDDPAPDACWQMLVGTLPAGAPCTFASECAVPAGGIAQCYDYATDPPVCVQNIGEELGESCYDTCVWLPGGGSMCISRGLASGQGTCWTTFGYYCGDTGTCVPVGQHGDRCEGNEQCAEGLRCVENACADPIALSEPCALVDIWQSPCEEGAYCAEDGICRALLGAGEACSEPRACKSGFCRDTGRCDPDSFDCRF